MEKANSDLEAGKCFFKPLVKQGQMQPTILRQSADLLLNLNVHCYVQEFPAKQSPSPFLGVSALKSPKSRRTNAIGK